ncbi:MAG: hypothetical protein HZB15_13470 [Actinobacteria bacterium]|nr:hypothetical protein [Actinomycetota bacterium]
METPRARWDARSFIVVPARPGPVRALLDAERRRDEVDDALDELFGEPDDRGPGIADAVLVAGGLGLLVVAQVASWPAIASVAGIAAVGLGVVLPVRSLWRRIDARRHRRKVRALVGDGVLLRTDSRAVRSLLDAHERLTQASQPLVPAARAEVEAVGHAALFEVASLLDGHPPVSSHEFEYIDARCAAVAGLLDVVVDERVGDGDADRRRALVEARREVEQIAGTSSIAAASELARRLLGPDG